MSESGQQPKEKVRARRAPKPLRSWLDRLEEDRTTSVGMIWGTVWSDLEGWQTQPEKADPDDDPLSAVLVSGPGHGSLTQNADGSFNYTPVVNFYGSDSFTYMANDSPSQAAASVTLTITPANDGGRDTLIGGSGNDVLDGYDAQLDHEPLVEGLYAGAGNDVIYGSDSDDALIGPQTIDAYVTSPLFAPPRIDVELWPLPVLSLQAPPKRATLATVQEAERYIVGINEDLDVLESPYIAEFQTALDALAKKPLESVEESRRIVTLVQNTADRLRVVFLCPKCQEPARLRCKSATRSKHALIGFEHYVDGKQEFHEHAPHFPAARVQPQS